MGQSTTRTRKKPVAQIKRGSVAEKTRKRLLAVGLRAFANKGLRGVNLQEDILKPAKVSSGSFYHQFADKTDLLLEILDLESARILEQIEKSTGEQGSDTRQNFAVYFDMVDRSPHFVKIYIREFYSDDRRVQRKIRRHNDATIDNTSQLLERLNEAAGLSIDAEVGGLLIGSLLISVITHYLGLSAREREKQRDALISGMTNLVSGGITNVRRS